MEVLTVKNSAIKTFLSQFRNAQSSIYDCSVCVENMSIFLAGAISNSLETDEVEIKTPLGNKISEIISEDIVLVPVMRAGLSMLSGFQRILPKSSVGFVWAHRNKDVKAEIDVYKFPAKMVGKTIILLDTMLATAGTINAVTNLVSVYEPKQIIVASILATELGINSLSDKVAMITVVDTTDILDENMYIYPGVGDSGDRLYG